MPAYNRVIILGNVTRDPELRYTPSGTAVCDLGLAINEKTKGPSGEWVESATFVDVTLWGRTAEVAAEYLHKGTPALIEGRLKLDSWQDDQGNKRSKLKVIGERLQMIGSKGDNAIPDNEETPPPTRRPPPAKNSPKIQATPATPSEEDEGDDIPF